NSNFSTSMPVNHSATNLTQSFNSKRIPPQFLQQQQQQQQQWTENFASSPMTSSSINKHGTSLFAKNESMTPTSSFYHQPPTTQTQMSSFLPSFKEEDHISNDGNLIMDDFLESNLLNSGMDEYLIMDIEPATSGVGDQQGSAMGTDEVVLDWDKSEYINSVISENKSQGNISNSLFGLHHHNNTTNNVDDGQLQIGHSNDEVEGLDWLKFDI
ncbi:hypothetical protein WICPIJ_004818, partial [Wickerhamomyces pijperi]